jgi:ATP-dependent Lon protease
MEVIHLPGYILEEKRRIAFRYLIPRQMEENGLAGEALKFSQAAVTRIIDSYTREAGLRNLEREIASICRKMARKVVEGGPDRLRIAPSNLHRFLGPPQYQDEGEMEGNSVGVATGLAWTAFGGEILFVETQVVKGKGVLSLTGSLGEVMKESAQAALTYIRSRADELGIREDFYQSQDIHVHVPAGAIPKDGPSAGVTIACSVISALTGSPVRRGIAMTGEISLTGRLLPVGGIKEKVLAARRAGLREVILPERNRKDLDEIPRELRSGMTLRFCRRIDEVLESVFPPPPKKASSGRKSGSSIGRSPENSLQISQ